nr:uncharacterized protein LOC113403678 [Vanessa tameamea]
MENEAQETESDMYIQHLKKVVEKLKHFEKKPKDIRGRQITEWFSLGEDIFYEFNQLGISVKWDYSLIKKGIEVNEVVINITQNQEWLQTFINIYPNIRIDLDLVGSAGDICKVRSGIEVLLRGFVNVDTHFNKVLQDLEELGEVDEFDRCLSVWRNTGHRPDFASNEKQSTTPKHHWWWY